MKILIILLLLFPVNLWAATDYYVTQSGSDPDCAGSPCSVATFNGLSGTGYAGDTFYFSGPFSTQITVNLSGTTGNYITFDGTDAQINTNISSIGVNGLISATNRNYLRFQNFTIDGQQATGGENRAGIAIFSSSGSSDYIIIDNCDITRSGNAVWLWGNVGNVLITNNYFHTLGESGVWSLPRSGEADASHNIVIGGSSGNGNIIKNAGYNDNPGYDVDSDIYVDLGDHIVISYNHLYSDSAVLSDPSSYGFSGLYSNEGRNMLVEYNTIHGHAARNHRSGLNFKDDMDASRKTSDVIIRYNRIYDEVTDSTSWGGSSSGIVVGNSMQYYYVYGNYIENCGGGVYPNSGWSTVSNTDGVDGDHIYVFSNIINSTLNFGIYVGGQPGAAYDDLNDIYIFNNTIYRSSTDPTEGSGFNATGIFSQLGDADTQNFYVKNNVIIDSRPNESDYIQMQLRNQSDLYPDYNHYHHTGGTSNLYYIDSSCTPCVWNSGSVPTGYGDNDTEGNPLLVNPANGDFTISSSDSPLVNSGTNMGNGAINQITINGISYAVEWGTALAPDTDWSTTPPTVATVSRDTYGWERGAYAFIDPITGIEGITISRIK